MAKILLVTIVIVVAYFLMRGFRRPADQDRTDANGTHGGDMVRCARCGIHVPREEAKASADLFFCSEKHEHEYRDSS